MTEYERGYRAGYHDGITEASDPAHGMLLGEQEAERLDWAESVGDPTPSPEDESDYWLGYYHGRFHARTGVPAAGAAGHVPRGL
ncbi:MAG: hypothetical protein ACE5MK_12410 [Acidobacteriota bacterium]